MGLFDRIRKSVESLAAHAKMDDFLIAEIDKIISSKWEKLSEKRPLSVGGISLEDEAEYNFTYRSPKGVVRVEMEHEFPHVEVEMKTEGRKLERVLMVSDFVEKDGAELKLKNREKLQKIIEEMIEAL